jgi:hypothetical protein
MWWPAREGDLDFGFVIKALHLLGHVEDLWGLVSVRHQVTYGEIMR